MSKEYFPIHEWEKEKMDKLVKDKEREYNQKELEKMRKKSIEEGREEGREQEKTSIIKSMLKKNMKYEDISDVSGKSIDEIKEIEKSIKD